MRLIPIIFKMKYLYDEDWILYCNTASKCVRFGTIWGPKEMTDFKQDELSVLQLFLDKREKNA